MARQRPTFSVQCNHDGCTESTLRRKMRRDDARAASRERLLQWRSVFWCERHDNSERLLSPTNRTITTEMTAGPSENFPNLTGLYWSGGSGFEYGLGWKAFANDFPEGTVLRVTVEVVLPEAQSEVGEGS